MNQLKAAFSFPSGQTMEIIHGDLTRERVDAIVNAANSHLAHGGGVARAIACAGGSAIQDESDAWVRQNGPVTHAAPAYTSGGTLPCRYVIHAVGPIWGEGEEDRKLTEAVDGSLARAESMGLRSVALPAISTGIFGFPKERAARVIIEAVRGYFVRVNPSGIELVRLVLWDEQGAGLFASEAERQWEQDDHLSS